MIILFAQIGIIVLTCGTFFRGSRRGGGGVGKAVTWPRSSMGRIPACRQAGKFLKAMYTVYAIRIEVDKRIYVGFTADLNRRLKEHNAGKNSSTKGFLPWHLIYKEVQATRLAARAREKYLKSGVGKEFLKSL